MPETAERVHLKQQVRRMMSALSSQADTSSADLPIDSTIAGYIMDESRLNSDSQTVHEEKRRPGTMEANKSTYSHCPTPRTGNAVNVSAYGIFLCLIKAHSVRCASKR